MELDLLSLDVDVLKRLYTAKEKELEAAILSGTAWDEVSIKRKALSDLSSALHTKLLRQGIQSQGFPARQGKPKGDDPVQDGRQGPSNL